MVDSSIGSPVHQDVEPLKMRLLKATIGSCSCDTKTHELAYHDPMCHFRLFSEAFNRIP